MNDKLVIKAFRVSSSSLTLSLSVSPSSNARLPSVNFSFGTPMSSHWHLSFGFTHINRWVGVVGGVFVCASWALRATNRVITVVAGPDDADSIAPMPDSARSGGLRSKWTGTALRARSSNAPLQPATWADSGVGSPYGSTYSGSSYAGSPVGSPMPYTPYSPVVPPPRLPGRTPSPSGFAVPGPSSGLGLSPNLFSLGLPGSGRTPTTAATLQFAYSRSRYTLAWSFPAHPAFAVKWAYVTPTVEGREKGRLRGCTELRRTLVVVFMTEAFEQKYFIESSNTNTIANTIMTSPRL